jgi:hypothetical protein
MAILSRSAFFAGVLVVVTAGCGGDSSPTDDGGKLPPPKKGRALQVTLDVGRAASVSVDPTQGGQVDAIGSDGALYHLDLPAHAFDSEDPVTVTLTPASIDAPLLTGSVVAGVQFAPEGLLLSRPATLTVTLPTEVDRRDLMVLQYAHLGDDSHLVPYVAMELDAVSTIQVPVFHFSGAAVATGTMGSDYFKASTGDPAGGYQEAIGRLYARALNMGLSGPWYDETMAAEFSGLMMGWLSAVVTPAFDEALRAVNAAPLASFEKVERAIGVYVVWEYQLLGWWACWYLEYLSLVPEGWPYLKERPWNGRLSSLGLDSNLDAMIDEYVNEINTLIENGVADQKCRGADFCERRTYFDMMPRWVEMVQHIEGTLGRPEPGAPHLINIDYVLCSYCAAFGNRYVKEIGVEPTSVVLSVGESVSVEILLLNAYQLGSPGGYICETQDVDPATAIWTSSNENVATVSSGVITGQAPGSTVVFASDEGQCMSRPIGVTVTQVVYRGQVSFAGEGTHPRATCCNPGGCCYWDDWRVDGTISIELVVDSTTIAGHATGSEIIQNIWRQEEFDPHVCECGPSDSTLGRSFTGDAVPISHVSNTFGWLVFNVTPPRDCRSLWLEGTIQEDVITGNIMIMLPMMDIHMNIPIVTVSITLTRVSGSSSSSRVGGASAQVPLRR